MATFDMALSMSVHLTYTLRDIAKNAEIDVLWEEAQQTLEPLRARLNRPSAPPGRGQ